MSLILDALNRSRTEAEPVPGLASEPLFLPENESPWMARLPWIALAVALLLIAWLVSDRVFTSSDEGEGVKTPAAQKVVKGVADAKPAVAKDAPAPNKPAANRIVKKPAAAKVAMQTLPPASPEAVKGAAVEVEAVAKMKSKDRAAVEQLYAAPKAPAPAKVSAKPKPKPKPKLKPKAKPVPVESELDIAKMVQMAEREKRNAALEEHPAPFVASLSQPIKDAIPTLLYERHDYNSKAVGRSSVVINGKTLRKGGNAGRGVKVDEILRDSVVLKHQGTQFRLRALNSWVNL
ncbi:MAG: general secretion pathway protein GspB [Halioglobus sp.]